MTGKLVAVNARRTTGQAAHGAAREPGPPTRGLCALGWDGAEWGDGVPASDRAGVWGGAPRYSMTRLARRSRFSRFSE